MTDHPAPDRVAIRERVERIRERAGASRVGLNYVTANEVEWLADSALAILAELDRVERERDGLLGAVPRLRDAIACEEALGDGRICLETESDADYMCRRCAALAPLERGER